MFISLFLSFLLSLTCAQITNNGNTAVLSNGVTINGVTQSANAYGYGGNGNQDSTTVRAWLGIPYATAGRFQAPTQYDWGTYSTASPFQANTFGPRCPQDGVDSYYNNNGTYAYNENCLYLNIYAPNNYYATTTNNITYGLPVMVFIHGGGFTRGSGSLYDGGALATVQSGNPGVIVVTINYRLGALGWLYTPSIQGNFGFMDQQMALAWVTREIGNFGGDNSRITLSGQSAGGISVLDHMISPGSSGYFSQAIIHSGYAYAQPTDMATTMGQNFAAAVGCPYTTQYNNSYYNYNGSYTNYNTPYDYQMNCLMNIDVATLVNSGYSTLTMFGPVVDGTIIPSDPVTLFRSRQFTPMPVLYGNTRDESSLFYCPFGEITTDNYTQSVTSFINMMYPNQPNLAQTVLQHWPSTSFSSSPLQAKISIMNIIQWFAGSALPLGYVTEANYRSNILTYQYLFDYVPGWTASGGNNFNGNNSGSCFGAAHMYELPFLFPGYVQSLTGTGYVFTNLERQLSYYMMGSWSRFITDGWIEEWMPAVAFNFGDNGKWFYNSLNEGGRDAMTEFMREDITWFWNVSNTPYVRRQNIDDSSSASSLPVVFTLLVASILVGLY